MGIIKYNKLKHEYATFESLTRNMVWFHAPGEQNSELIKLYRQTAKIFTHINSYEVNVNENPEVVQRLKATDFNSIYRLVQGIIIWRSNNPTSQELKNQFILCLASENIISVPDKRVIHRRNMSSKSIPSDKKSKMKNNNSKGPRILGAPHRLVSTLPIDICEKNISTHTEEKKIHPLKKLGTIHGEESIFKTSSKRSASSAVLDFLKKKKRGET